VLGREVVKRVTSITDIQSMTKTVAIAEHIEAPEYAVPAEIGGEIPIEDQDRPAKVEPSARRTSVEPTKIRG
jgi:hypothetical protein